MGKLVRIVAAGALSFSMLSGVVSAQTASNCSINGTGPGSVNTCTLNEDNSLTVVCTNGVTLDFTNQQVANSGAATVNGNTTAGGANTGNANNTNQFIADIAASCGAAAPAGNGGGQPAAPAGQSNGRGQAAKPAAAAPAAAAATPAPVAVQALPNTGENSIAMQAGIGALALATIAGVSHLALGAYRRFSLGRI